MLAIKIAGAYRNVCMSSTETQTLRVLEFGGTARSGKGTIVSSLARAHPEIVTEETGADYRAVTRGLLLGEVIEPDMPAEVIEAAIRKIDEQALIDLAARRKEIEAETGRESLYAADVNAIVHHVSPLNIVRAAVKGGFMRRVERVRDEGNTGVLLVDGRNLGAIIEPMKGTRLVLRTFIYCEPYEAARRECMRAQLDVGTEAWDEKYEQSYGFILDRNSTDKNRELDPVVPDKDCIDYWRNQSLLDIQLRTYADLAFDGNIAQAAQAMLLDRSDSTEIGSRIGAGIKAVREKRQVHLDTTPFRNYPNSIEAMNLAVSRMYDEAITTDRILNDT